jgi:hypothetical protein
MKYRVHRLDIKMEKEHSKLEQFLNNLRGEVISIIANVRPKFQGMGATAKVDFLLIVERLSR